MKSIGFKRKKIWKGICSTDKIIIDQLEKKSVVFYT